MNRSLTLNVAALLFLAAIVLILLIMIGQVRAGERTQQFYNNKGQNVGSATTNSNGYTTFRNERGQVTGSATTRGNTTTFYDSYGRQQGTATAPRR
jgi:YD repeat-containing protein